MQVLFVTGMMVVGTKEILATSDIKSNYNQLRQPIRSMIDQPMGIKYLQLFGGILLT
jgi:hypothetical protein